MQDPLIFIPPRSSCTTLGYLLSLHPRPRISHHYTDSAFNVGINNLQDIVMSMVRARCLHSGHIVGWLGLHCGLQGINRRPSHDRSESPLYDRSLGRA